MWRAAQYTNPRANLTVQAFTGTDGKEANTSLEKEEMLRQETFPPNNGNENYRLPTAGSAHTCVT